METMKLKKEDIAIQLPKDIIYTKEDILKVSELVEARLKAMYSVEMTESIMSTIYSAILLDGDENNAYCDEKFG